MKVFWTQWEKQSHLSWISIYRIFSAILLITLQGNPEYKTTLWTSCPRLLGYGFVQLCCQASLTAAVIFVKHNARQRTCYWVSSNKPRFTSPLFGFSIPASQPAFIVQLLFLNFYDFLPGLGPKNLLTWRHRSYLSGAGSHTDLQFLPTFDFIVTCQTVHIPVGVISCMPSLCIRTSPENAILCTDMWDSLDMKIC